MSSLGKLRSELAILLSVNAENEEYMRKLRWKTRGKWLTGRRIDRERLVLPATIYFYATTQGKIYYKATVEKIRRMPSERRAELELSNIDDIKPKEYTDFQKHAGTRIMGRNAFQGIIYILDPKY